MNKKLYSSPTMYVVDEYVDTILTSDKPTDGFYKDPYDWYD